MTERSSSSSSSDRMEIVLDPEVFDAMDTSTAEGDDAKDKNDKRGDMANAEKFKDVTADAAASEGAPSGVDDAGAETGDASVNPSAVRLNAGRSMDVDDATPDASVLSSPDYIKRINNELANTSKTESRADILLNQTIMDIVEDELQKVTESICVGPPEVETWHQVAPPPQVSQPPPLMYQSSPQVTQPPPRAPTTDFSVRSGPSWGEPYNLDYLLAHSPTRREHLRPARLARNDRANRDGSVTTALRRSRIVRSGPRCYESESQPPPLVYPALYPTQQHAAHEPKTYQTIRQLLNKSISIVNPSQTSTPRFSRQYSPQIPPMVYKQASSPMRLTTSRRPGSMSSSSQSGSTSSSSQPGLISSRQPGVMTSSPTKLITSCPTILITSSPATLMPSSPPSLVSISAPRSSPISRSQSLSSVSTELFDLPYVSDKLQQPLDLSLLPRQLPTLIPISQAQIARPSETHTVARPRFTPRTHTVTSTNNTVIYYAHDHLTRTEEPYQTTNRIEMYKSCSEHLLNRPPSRHRTRTPTDILPEYQQYQTWPEDDLTQTDHTEEVKTTEMDAWFDTVEASDIAAAVAASLQSNQPTSVTRPPPMIGIVPPLSPVRSPDTTSDTSPRTTLS